MQPAHTYSWQRPFANKRFRILFVDDNLYAVKTVRRILEDAGYIVFSATNYVDALQILDSTHIHLGIFDLNLAGDAESGTIKKQLARWLPKKERPEPKKK